MHTLTPLFRVLLNGHDNDSKLGTNHGAHVASRTLITVIQIDNVITTTVSLSGFAKSLLRAELNAELALFAPILEHSNPVATCLYTLLLYDFSPILSPTLLISHIPWYKPDKCVFILDCTPMIGKTGFGSSSKSFGKR